MGARGASAEDARVHRQVVATAQRWLVPAFTRARQPFDDMTSGQRWTAVLCLVLALATASVGTPSAARSAIGALRSATALASPASGSPSAPKGTPSSPTPGAVAPAAALASPAFERTGSATPIGSADGATTTTPSGALRVAAAIGNADKDDAAAFLGDAGFDWTPVTVDSRPSLCDELAAAGELVLAAQALDRTVADCLADRGRIVVSYDEGGSRLGDDGALLSTRFGLADSLAETVSALKGTPSLGRALVIVTTTDRKALVDVAVRRLRAAGMKVVGVEYVDGESEVAPGVLSAVRSGADTVAFALPTDLQTAWIVEAAVLSPGDRYLVADAADAIVAGTYPPGTTVTAYTAVRLPWYRAKHGVTAAQQACGRTRPASVTSYLWCENARIATELAARVAAGADLGASARHLLAESPLTADLGPLGHDAWGPTDAAVIAWEDNCSCWVERRPFAPRVETAG